MSLIRLGLGSALLLTLGFSSAPAPAEGSYVTLGYGQTASKVVTLGLTPSSITPTTGGSYITLGQGQTASKFAMLGLRPGPAVVPPDEIVHSSGGRRFLVDRSMKLHRDGELMLFVAAAVIILD